MRAEQDAYAFFSQDVSVFRGEQQFGYPFLTEPFRIHAIACSLWTQRPLLKAVTTNGQRQAMYSKKEDNNMLVDRLNLIAHIALRETAGEAQASPEEKPILILPVLGSGGNYFHPTDSVASILRAWRRRFARFFHSVYVCCMDRGRSDYQLSDLIDEQINKTTYNIADDASLADKAIPWHWDKRELLLSVQGPKLEVIGNFIMGGHYDAPVDAWRISKRELERSQFQKLPGQTAEKSKMSVSAYKEAQDRQAVEDTIKTARREGNWLVEHTDAKLGGLKNANTNKLSSVKKGASNRSVAAMPTTCSSETRMSIRRSTRLAATNPTLRRSWRTPSQTRSDKVLQNCR